MQGCQSDTTMQGCQVDTRFQVVQSYRFIERLFFLSATKPVVATKVLIAIHSTRDFFSTTKNDQKMNQRDVNGLWLMENTPQGAEFRRVPPEIVQTILQFASSAVPMRLGNVVVGTLAPNQTWRFTFDSRTDQGQQQVHHFSLDHPQLTDQLLRDRLACRYFQ